jgi:hypothetical protein
MRLRSVLGPDTSTIDAARIAGLLGWREDTDLDFKHTLDRTPKGRSALVSDLAAMANAIGGVIVVGIREEDTRAVELTPLQRNEQREDRTEIFQAVAESVGPPLTLDAQQVEADDGGYFLVLTVARSELAPHAFRRPGTQDLRYPVREGTRTRYLAEPELADRYRDRFRRAAALLDRLEQVRTEGEEVLQRSDDPQGWLCLALVPEASGRFDVEVGSPPRFAEWLRDLLRELSPIGMDADSSIQGSVAFRRVLVGEWRNHRGGGIPIDLHCQFHTDGGGFFARWCFFVTEVGKLRNYKPPLRSPLADNETRRILVTTAEQLFDGVVVGLSALARHAVDHCGSDGDAIVSASLLPVGRIEATVAASMHIIGGLSAGLRQTPGTHELQRGFTSQHTLPLRALHRPSAEMMVAVRLLMTDLLSLFGQAGVEQIRDDGSLVSGRFRSDMTPEQISSWARRWRVPAVASEEA